LEPTAGTESPLALIASLAAMFRIGAVMVRFLVRLSLAQGRTQGCTHRCKHSRASAHIDLTKVKPS
jgi:hypothetical protein